MMTDHRLSQEFTLSLPFGRDRATHHPASNKRGGTGEKPGGENKGLDLRRRLWPQAAWTYASATRPLRRLVDIDPKPEVLTPRRHPSGGAPRILDATESKGKRQKKAIFHPFRRKFPTFVRFTIGLRPSPDPAAIRLERA
jgi:hypothetical protein